LVDIVDSGWQASACRGDELGGLLRLGLPAVDLVALGDVWEATGVVLSRRLGRLATTAAGQLVAGWSRLAANRADECHRLRDQHPQQDHASVRSTGDPSKVVAR
jgi:hypothetical protein